MILAALIALLAAAAAWWLLAAMLEVLPEPVPVREAEPPHDWVRSVYDDLR